MHRMSGRYICIESHNDDTLQHTMLSMTSFDILIIFIVTMTMMMLCNSEKRFNIPCCTSDARLQQAA